MFRKSIRVVPAGVLPTAVSYAGFFTTHRALLPHDPAEAERESRLREEVLKGYKGMQVPPMSNYEYGHFSAGGVVTGAQQQAFGALSQMNPNTTGGSGNAGMGFGVGGVPLNGRGKVDWLMLFTGCVLVYFSGKIIFQQANRGVDSLEMPLWVASIDRQAQHLLFSVQFDQHVRDDLKREFQQVRQSTPLADFFDWVHARRPEFGHGRRYSIDNAMQIMVSALSSSDQQQLVGFARTVQQALFLRNTGSDPQEQLDSFLDKLQGATIPVLGGKAPIGGNMSTQPSPPVQSYGHSAHPTYPSAASVYPPPPGYVPSTPYSSESQAEISMRDVLNVAPGQLHGSDPFKRAG